jgi:serine/threonine protein kinase
MIFVYVSCGTITTFNSTSALLVSPIDRSVLVRIDLLTAAFNELLQPCVTTNHNQREIVQMKLCNHANVVRSHCSFVQGHFLWLVMDYLAGGSVLDIMKFAHPTGLTDEALIATILYEALQGINYLHSTGRIHRYVDHHTNKQTNTHTHTSLWLSHRLVRK